MPGFIVQPLLENAIVHGTDRIQSGEGVIKLSVSVDDRPLYISVLERTRKGRLYKFLHRNENRRTVKLCCSGS